jgi:hypothetical protein
MNAVNLMNGSKSSETLDLRAAVDDTVRLRRNEESAGTNATLRVLTESVGSFEERVFDLVKQFAHRIRFIDNACTQELADGLRPDTEY